MLKRKSSFIATLILLLVSPYVYSSIITVPTDYLTIQEGIGNASEGDTVLVLPGIYEEVINFQGKEIVVASMYLFTKDTGDISQTIIDGNQLDFVVTFENNEDSNSILTGFTLTNGGVDSVSLLGGGIFCNNSSPTIQSNKIVFNYPTGCIGMGAIYCINSNAFISGNIIKNNGVTGGAHGGAIVCITSSPEISENLIENNGFHGVRYSAGIFCSESLPIITNNKIISNSGGYLYPGGGGITCVNESIGFIKFNIIANNSHDGWGAGILVKNSRAYVTNNTIYGNHRGIIALDTSHVSINSSIIWEVFSPNNSIYEEAGSQIFSRYTDVQDTLWMYMNCGNINSDPLFVDPSNNDFRLQPNSPCIDAGSPFKPNDPDGSRIDMGAISTSKAVAIQEPITSKYNITIYPNPYSYSAILKIKGEFSINNAALKIFDLHGWEVKRILDISTKEIIIKRDDLMNGIYFYQLSNQDEIIGTGKLVIH